MTVWLSNQHGQYLDLCLTPIDIELMDNKYVLIVDDDKDIQMAIRMILELHGYTVNTVSNGKEALESLKSVNLPSVILLDLMMPVMDGFEFIKKIEASQMATQIPVIVMTAARNKVAEVKKYKTLLKPFDVSLLLNLVGEYYQKTV